MQIIKMLGRAETRDQHAVSESPVAGTIPCDPVAGVVYVRTPMGCAAV
jgi:hypothetical protein